MIVTIIKNNKIVKRNVYVQYTSMMQIIIIISYISIANNRQFRNI
jgi:hypothetical protein